MSDHLDSEEMSLQNTLVNLKSQKVTFMEDLTLTEEEMKNLKRLQVEVDLERGSMAQELQNLEEL